MSLLILSLCLNEALINIKVKVTSVWMIEYYHCNRLRKAGIVMHTSWLHSRSGKNETSHNTILLQFLTFCDMPGIAITWIAMHHFFFKTANYILRVNLCKYLFYQKISFLCCKMRLSSIPRLSLKPAINIAISLQLNRFLIMQQLTEINCQKLTNYCIYAQQPSWSKRMYCIFRTIRSFGV